MASLRRRDVMLALVPGLAFARENAIAGTGGIAATPDGEPPDAREVMLRNFLATKVGTLRARLTMTLLNADGGRRVRETALLAKLQANGIDSNLAITFLAPGDVSGTRFLLIEHSQGDDDTWVFLPALQKVRRLVSNNKKDSFFGSDFAYGDILLPPVESCLHRLLPSERFQGVPCFVVESTGRDPETRSDSGYSHRISCIDSETFVERRVEYFDLSGGLLKVQTTSRHVLADAARRRWLVLGREMRDVQTGHRTLIEVADTDVRQAIPDEAFSVRALERG